MFVDTAVLLEKFGTIKSGDCQSCLVRPACLKYTNTKFLSPSNCIMGTYMDLHNINQLYNKSDDPKVNSIVRRINKLKMMGFKLDIACGWIILYNDAGSMTWINPKYRVFPTEMYQDITVHGNNLACKTKDGKLRLFNRLRPSVDLLAGFNGELRQYKSGSYYWPTWDKAGIFRCIIKDTSDSKRDYTLIVDSNGNSVIVIGIDEMTVSTYSDRVLFEGVSASDSGKFLKTDNKLKVIKCGFGVTAFNP